MGVAVGHQGVARPPPWHLGGGLPKGAARPTPSGYRATPMEPWGWPKPPSMVFRGGFSHPLGSMGVAEPPPVPIGGEFDHSLVHQG
jgi:hypothetical protein